MNHDTHTALVKLFWAWFLVGISQMTPLQAVQMIAAIAATIYTAVQTVVLIIDRVRKERVQ